MKRKSTIIGGVLVAGIALGIFAIFKFSGASSGGDADAAPPENVPSVVTVQTGALKRMTLHRYVSGYGTVEAAPATANESAAGGMLAAPTAGVVAKVNVIAGQHVEKGDALVELNSATAKFDYAKAEVERQKKLFAQQNTSVKNLQDAQAQLASLQIVAPVSGTVTRISVKAGEAVDANTIVAEVIDLNRLAVSAKIPASQAGELKTGEEVQISGTGFQPVNGQDARPTIASLSFVAPAVDANDGTVLVSALLPADSGLRPGQFVQLKIVTVVHTNCLAAPSESIVTDENGKSVIALVKGDEATQMPVKIGLQENGWTEIEGTNLNIGDSVVTVGAYGLPEKTKIHAANSADESSTTNSTQAQ